MQIQVRYFAILRERLRTGEQALELPDGADVAAALDALAGEHEAIAGLRGRFQTAVNMAIAPADTVLADGDELALIPPVAGGNDRLAHMVHDRPPSLDACVAAVKTAEIGAVVTFTGCVRDHNEGRTVERLEYEAYDAMANKVLAALCAAIETELPGTRLAVEHRAGKLVVGDIAVVIAAAAAHRAEAFEGCRAMIERLKKDVPIWKKEIGPDGDEWIGTGP